MNVLPLNRVEHSTFIDIGFNMNISFVRPNGFDSNVFVVNISLASQETDAIGGADFSFELPQHSSWFFRPLTKRISYLRPALRAEPGKRFGVIRDGHWQMIVQSNGVAEPQNPVSRRELIADLRQSVVRSLTQTQ